MKENRNISKKILLELSNFYDDYDIGEHEEDWKEVPFEIDLKESKYIVSIKFRTLESLIKLKQKTGKSSSEIIEDLVEKAVS